MKSILFVLLLFFSSPSLYAQDSDMIKADRRALAEAEAGGDSSKILAAKEQLSDDLSLEEQQRRQDLEGISIPLTPDGQGHLSADVEIDHMAHASLIVDTGSPVVMLTAAMAQKLQLDYTQGRRGYVEVLNGKYSAATVSLSSVKLGEYEARDVDAIILLEDAPQLGDGLLGLSFLSKFHFSLDQANQKLLLRKIST